MAKAKTKKKHTKSAVVTPTPVVLVPLKWRRSPNFSSRRGTKIDLLVYHESAGHYQGDIGWLCTPTVYGPEGNVISGPDASATAVVREDGGEITQLVHVKDKAWTQAAFNARALGIEHSNITAKGYSTEAQLRESARFFAWMCWKYDIPVRIARAGQGPGICRHLDLGAAGGGHTQCGMGDHDFERWMHMIALEHTRGGFRKTYLI